MNSHNFSSWFCMDIDRRKLMLVTLGTFLALAKPLKLKSNMKSFTLELPVIAPVLMHAPSTGLSKVAGCRWKSRPTWLVSAGYSAWHFFMDDVFQLKSLYWPFTLITQPSTSKLSDNPASTACDIISCNGQGQLCHLTCAEWRSFNHTRMSTIQSRTPKILFHYAPTFPFI